jgi:hypothetical protein
VLTETHLRLELAAAEMLVPAEMHLKPAEVRLAAAEMLMTVEMHPRPGPGSRVNSGDCRNVLEA